MDTDQKATTKAREKMRRWYNDPGSITSSEFDEVWERTKVLVTPPPPRPVPAQGDYDLDPANLL